MAIQKGISSVASFADPITRGRRRRVWYVSMAVVTAGIGLGVHESTGVISTALQDKMGDGLWAAMTAWWIGAVIPNVPLRFRIPSALALCFAVEISQLYHTEGLDSLRRTTLGHLLLGSGFDVRDLFAYTLGVSATGFFEGAARHGRTWPSTFHR